MTKKDILIATGGTGGHVFPALSLANYFKNKNLNVKIATDRRGYEFLKNYNNINYIKIPASPLIKESLITTIVSIMIITASVIKSFLFLLFNRPTIIFGMGGYSSFPICIAAKILRIKFIIYENNLIIGKANKFLLPFAKKVFVSYKCLEGISANYNNKIFEIGNIVREEIINLQIKNSENNLFDEIKILVLGGSQAAKTFAEKLPKIFEKLKTSGIPIKIYQQCQKEQTNVLAEFYKKVKIECKIFNFTNKIIDYYSKANLVITRSGASVLGELVNVNIPFISVPLPTSADNHQFKNAVYYKKKRFRLFSE